MFGYNLKLKSNELYSKFNCQLLTYSLPFVKRCFVIFIEKDDKDNLNNLLGFSYEQAKIFSKKYSGEPEAFVLLVSGNSIRKRNNWHVHIFVVTTRLQKAWLYFLLGIKSFVLALIPKRYHFLTSAKKYETSQ